MTTSEIASAPTDLLQLRLIKQVAKDPVRWDMVVYVGAPGTLKTTRLLRGLRRESISGQAH